MKIGVCDYYYDSDGLLTAPQRYELFAEAGFSCIDFNTAPVTIPLYTEPEAEMERLIVGMRREIENAGLTVHQVHGPWTWPPTKDQIPELRPQRAEEMKKSMRMAKLLGCRNWVVHPIMPFKTKDIPEGNAAGTWELNVEFMGWLLDYAKEINVTICLENMPHREFSMAKPDKIMEFVRLMDDPHFAVCLDFGHVATQEGLQVADQIRLVGDKLQAVHIHDNNGIKDQHTWPGQGIVDWKETAKALKEVDYQGVFSLETYPWRDPDGDPVEAIPAEEFLKKAKKLAALAHSIME